LEDIERIFEPYFTQRPDGTGLGLALVKRIITEHNGDICAENHQNGGARFKIILPLEE
jgi:signal transduction histidine kinase